MNAAQLVSLPEHFIEGFLCLPQDAHSDWIHVAKIAKDSAIFDAISHCLLHLIQQKETKVPREISELYLSTLIERGVSLKEEEKSREVSEALLRETELHPEKVPLSFIFDWMEGIVSLPEEFYDLFFGILDKMEVEKRREFLDMAFHHFPNEMKPLQQLMESNPIEIVYQSFHNSPKSPVPLFLERCTLLLFPQKRKEFIQSFIPSIFDIPSGVDEIANWCHMHRFFKEIEPLESMMLFKE